MGLERDANGNLTGRVVVREGERKWKEAVADKRKGRRAATAARIAARKQRTPEQQLALLDKRLGIGVGAKKERLRLAKLIKLAKAEAEAKVEAEAKAKAEQNKPKVKVSTPPKHTGQRFPKTITATVRKIQPSS